MATKVDDKMFWAIKTLLKNGATYEEVSNFMKVAKITVGRISRAETPEEYRHKMCAIALEYKNKKKAAEKAAQEPEKPAPLPQVTLPQFNTDMRVIEALKRQNELLELISNKLVFIVEQLA